MLEILLCSLVTILPDYLFRRYAQGKRMGIEIDMFTVWYELRWGITTCVILAVSLITTIFYFHPSTTNAGSMYRTLTILSEGGGRVDEVYVENGQVVEAGAPLFKLDDREQRANVETAKNKVAEIEAARELAKADLEGAIALVDQAKAGYQQTKQELDRATELTNRGSSAVSAREKERLEIMLVSRQGGIDAAEANRNAKEISIAVLLPAQSATAQSALDQAEAALSKTVVYAGVKGRIEQFTLRPGDYVNPILRPAGILIPEDAGGGMILAGFGQITAQIVKPGTLAEVTCVSDPFKIHPMVVTAVQDVIPAGQIRPTDSLVDIQDRARPGTLSTFLAPLYPGSIDHIPRGSKCIANAYTNNHDRLSDPDLGTSEWLFLHMVDTVAIVHALILRIQALLLPVQTLVFAGH